MIALPRPDRARELRHEAPVCDPFALCEELGIASPRKKQPRGLLVCCPAHPEKDPSCSVRVGEDGTVAVHCFVCLFNADAIGLTMKVRAVTFPEAIEDLARFAGRYDLIGEATPSARPFAPAPRHAPPPAAPDVHHDVFAALLDRCGPLHTQPDASRFVHDSRFVGADAIAVGVTALPPAGPALRTLLDDLTVTVGADALNAAGITRDGGLTWPAHRLVIPWFTREGRLSTVQRRLVGGRSVRSYVFPGGCASPSDPFGAELFDEALAFCGDVPVVVTEGALDCLARRKLARLTSERAIVLGAPSCTMARPEWSQYFDGRDVYVSFDRDDAGDRGADRFIEICCAGARSVERERPIDAKDWSEKLAAFMGEWRAA